MRRAAKRHLVRRKSQGAARHKVDRVLFREPLHDLARALQSPGPGADVEGVSAVPVQMWPGVSPVPVEMRPESAVPVQTWQGVSPVPSAVGG
jgi:hypothetical protein